MTEGWLIFSSVFSLSLSSTRTTGVFPKHRYGAESMPTAARAGLRAIPHIAISYLPAFKSSRRVGQVVWTNSHATPSDSARDFASSMSAPWTSLMGRPGGSQLKGR